MIFSIHLVSTGVRPGDPAARPASMLIELMRPAENLSTTVSRGGVGLVRDYFDLVDVRRENQRLKAEVARARSDQARIAELEAENQRLTDMVELKDALGLDAVGASVIGSDPSHIDRTLTLGEGLESG